jgi:hypothetical protein
MKLPRLAGHAIAPLHLVAGFLFALLPASPYDNGTYAVYGAILVVVATAVVVAGWIAAEPTADRPRSPPSRCRR